MELRDETRALIWSTLVDFGAGYIQGERAAVDRILDIPEIKEALEWRAKAKGLAEAMARNRAAGYNQATDRCDLPPS